MAIPVAERAPAATKQVALARVALGQARQSPERLSAAAPLGTEWQEAAWAGRAVVPAAVQ